MLLTRRGFTLAAASSPLSIGALSQTGYPSRQVKVICGFVAGGGGDLMVRWYATQLAKLTGQSFIVENRVGAGGHLGTMALIQSKPDGYTMIAHGSAPVVGNTFLMKEANYDPLEDLAIVTTLNHLGLVLIVKADTDIKTVSDLTRSLKSKGKRALYGVHNASSRVASNLYFQKAGAEATEAGYKTSIDAVNDVVAGLIDFVFVDVTLGVGQARQGRVRALAVSPSTRAAFAPELPTMQEAGVPDFAYSVVWSAWMPKDTPATALATMHGLLNNVVRLEDTRKVLLDAGSDPLPSPSPEASKEVMKREVTNWREIVQRAGIAKQ